MAMQATHVRFALEFEKELGIKDRSEYLSGVMYPDSRYMCGIDRHLTHDSNLKITDALEGNDFEKGWKMHVLYDMLQHDYILGLFGITSKMVGYSDDWFTVSVAKFVEDLESFRLLKSSRIMESICPMQTPNNEDMKKLSRWYDLQKSVYCSANPSIESYKPLIDWFEEDHPDSRNKIISMFGCQINDKEHVEKVIAMFGDIVKEFYAGLESR